SANQYRDAALQVAVRADSFASAVARYSADQHDSLSKGEATITLQRGKKVNLRLQAPEGMTWPSGTFPEVYFDDFQHRVRIMRQPSNRGSKVTSDFNFLNLQEVGSGMFEFHLADSTPPFHVAVHAPGFLQYFEAGPFTLADVSDGTLTIDLPKPAAIEASFAPGDAEAGSLFKSAFLNVMWRITGESYLDVASANDPSLASRLNLTDLVPGDYMVSVRTQPQDDIQNISGTEINPGRYFDRRVLTLKAGQSETIDFRSTPYDPDAFRGTREAMIRLRKPDGQPAQGRRVSVHRFDGHYGSQPVFSGTVPKSGEILLTGITDRKPPSALLPSVYYVAVDNETLGGFDFATETGTETFDFTLPPTVGDFAPDVELTDLATGQVTSLQSFRGKPVFLEFWATWCGPCQEPMTKLNALAREQKTVWEDRVAIIPLSIDVDPDRVRQHLRQHDWGATSHFWTGEAGKGDFQSPAARAFIVRGVPTAFLIDPDGRILWRGHPQEQDLKSRIDQILK
ncbi:MAG TPA: TlpA disulfide reductase family protein, partial [Planctomicrobium sp.]|nr:TlpA disulfide reductase family protein [Planctomicrobium sp.]